MNIDRHVGDHSSEVRDWVTFCLDKLEAARDFRRGLSWGTEIVPGLTLEELIGAVVAAEQHLDAADAIAEIFDDEDDEDDEP